MGTRLYLVRHGQTEWNAVRKFQGHTDVPLSPFGRNQAAHLAKHLKKIKFDVGLTSDLIRAKETALIIIGKSNLELKTDIRLREINFGEWEGLTLEEIKSAYQDIVQKWWNEPVNTLIPGGEMYSEVAKRAMVSVEKIVENYPNKNVLLVSHGGAILSIICSIMGIDLNLYRRMRLDNCSLSIIHFPDNRVDNGILELFNCTY